jgi:hypothetical protein
MKIQQDIIQKIAAYSRRIGYMGNDHRLLATHISLFTALFVCRQRRGFIQPFSVNRRELMVLSKIASIATYHKCIKNLDDYGYIHYQPSFHPKVGSLIYWIEN